MSHDPGRDALEELVSGIIRAGGYQPRPEWGLGKGLVKCGNLDHPGWHFEVHVKSVGKGAYNVGIKRTLDDLNPFDGLPGNPREGRPVRARSFTVGVGYPGEEGRLARALRAEVEALRRQHDASDHEDAVADLAARIQELVERSPESAGKAIAALLGERLDVSAMEVLGDEVAAAASDYAP